MDTIGVVGLLESLVPDIGAEGGGGTAIYELYRYVPL